MPFERPRHPRLPVIEEQAERVRARNGGRPGPVNFQASLIICDRELSAAANAMARVLVLDSAISPRQRELAVLRMAWNCQSVYQFGQHTVIGIAAGMLPNDVYTVTRPLVDGEWSSEDAALLQMVDDLYTDDCVSEPTWQILLDHFSHADLIEFMIVIGWYRMAAGLSNACGIQLDAGLPGWPQPKADLSGLADTVNFWRELGVANQRPRVSALDDLNAKESG